MENFNSLRDFNLLDEEEVNLMAALLAHFAFCLDPYTDSYELTEMLQEFLAERPLNLQTIETIATLSRALSAKGDDISWN